MTLAELRYIVAVAEERNFRRAAEKAFVSQPALSLAVQKLEEKLGTQIFERGAHEVSLTPTGTAIVAQAKRILEECERLKALAGSGTDPLEGVFKLGVIYSIAPYLIPELIPALHKLAPNMPLEIEENLTANLEVMLENGVLDAIIIALPFGGGRIETCPLYDEDFNVLVPVSHPWAKRKEVRAEELSGEKVLLLNSGHCFSNQVVEACPDLARRGGRVLQGNSLETVRNMVASGLGISVLPSTANRAKYRSTLTRSISFAPPVPMRRVALAWRKSFVREKAVEALAQAVNNAISATA
jgi:LysR family transcriptional regulator, hydrogen peroxide-inducible genes activator